LKLSKLLHVAVGVIKNQQGNVLISLRHQSVHQGGLWEFPGGKVEKGESVKQALIRELKEELDISIQELMPLIKINHHYTDLDVLLDVWTVSLFSGEPKGCEGQKIKWVSPEHLSQYPFPAANIPIITAARLPDEYAILNGNEEDVLLNNLKRLLSQGVKLIQLRAKSLSAQAVMRLLKLATPLCQEKGVVLLVNSAVKNAAELNVDGLHLTARDLLALKQRPSAYLWVAASCHNQFELQHAVKIGINFVVLAPVLTTKTHPDVEPLGWAKFKQLANNVNLPIFALGGMQKKHKDIALVAGAQGIAGISTFLEIT
jgi:8-oxo-dGTP diphosphatase